MDKNNYVVKANKLIESKGRLETLEQKLFAILVSEIHTTDEDFKDYNLDITDVSELLGTTSNTIYKRLKVAADALMDKKIEIENINDKGKRSFIKTRLVSSAQHQEGERIITLHIDPVLKPYLLAIKGEDTPFTKYMLKNVLKLSTSYSIRIYEILKQRETMKSRIIELSDLKEILGVDAASYNVFNEFERRILKPSIVEVNKYTDINITYKKKKTGRAISHIEFDIETRYGCFDGIEDEFKRLEKEGIFDFKQIKIKAGLEKEKLSRKQLNTLYEIAVSKTDKYGLDPFEYIKKNYEYTKPRVEGGVFGYLEKAVKGDYAKVILGLVE